MSLQDPRHCTSSKLHLNLGHDAFSKPYGTEHFENFGPQRRPQFDSVTANSERLELLKISITVSGEN